METGVILLISIPLNWFISQDCLELAEAHVDKVETDLAKEKSRSILISLLNLIYAQNIKRNFSSHKHV